MPFTFSHPAAVLPFSYLPKKYVSFTALVVGSMIPDFEYFIHFSGESYYSHTWTGIFWYDLPFAIIICFLFHNYVRNELLLHLPKPLMLRCMHSFDFNWNLWFKKKWPVIILCILIGSATHLIWDALTHETSIHLEQTKYLKNKMIPDKDVVVYYSYWGINSAVGIILLLISFWKMPARKKPKVGSATKSYWPMIIIICLLILTARFTIKPEQNLVNIVDSCIAAFLVALLLTSLFQRIHTAH